MNSEQFTGFLNSPGALNGQSLPMLTELVKEYPYFQTAQVLLAKNLHNEKNIRYNAQLKIAAAYSTDRKRLYEIINGLETEVKPVLHEKQEEKPAKQTEEKKTTAEIPVDKQVFIPIEVKEKPVTEEKKEETTEPVTIKQQPIQEEKHTFTEWLKLTSIHSVTATEIKREKKKPSSKGELIDKFIKEEPKISKPRKAEFFSPVNMAKQSLIEDDDLVSETLAEIYEKQGFYAKAIKAYEKLSLKYPGKKLSFAARIENLKQKLNEQ